MVHSFLTLTLNVVSGQRLASAVMSPIPIEQEAWVGPRTYLDRPFGEEINLLSAGPALRRLGALVIFKNDKKWTILIFHPNL